MKLKLDENIPQSAATRLAGLGYDVDTVLDERLGGRSDEDVWAAAQAEGRFLVTHDLDRATLHPTARPPRPRCQRFRRSRGHRCRPSPPCLRGRRHPGSPRVGYSGSQ